MEDKNVISFTVEKHRWEDEKNKKSNKLVTVIVVFVCSLLFFGGGYFVGKLPHTASTSNEKINYIKNIMENKWYFSKDISNIATAIEDKILEGVTNFEEDQHTEYLTKDRFQAMQQQLQGSFYGIGVSYRQVSGQFLISKVFPNSPAEKAGLIKNDVMIKVDGESIVGKSTAEIAQKVRGERGTKVNVTYTRAGKEYNVDIIRDEVSLTLESNIIDNTGIVTLNSFTEIGGQEMAATLAHFQNQNIKKLIIDLRNNGGGYLQTTMEIAGMLMPKNSVVLQQEDVDGKMIQNRTNSDKQYQFDNIVVLINENSASASEVLSAALRENLNVKLVGKKSFGKGTVQITQPFKDGSAIKYTVAQWLSPKGNHINKVGVSPDYEIDEHEVTQSLLDKIKQDYQFDMVSDEISYTQKRLKFLNYNVTRNDGYFDSSTKNAIIAFQKDNQMSVTGILDSHTFNMINLKAQMQYNNHPIKYDTQLLKALEIVNGK